MCFLRIYPKQHVINLICIYFCVCGRRELPWWYISQHEMIMRSKVWYSLLKSPMRVWCGGKSRGEARSSVFIDYQEAFDSVRQMNFPMGVWGRVGSLLGGIRKYMLCWTLQGERVSHVDLLKLAERPCL